MQYNTIQYIAHDNSSNNSSSSGSSNDDIGRASHHFMSASNLLFPIREYAMTIRESPVGRGKY